MRAEKYFTFFRLKEEEHLEAAMEARVDDALLWYDWEHQKRPIQDSEEMKG